MNETKVPETETVTKKNKEGKRGYGARGFVYDAVSVLVSSITLLAIAFSFCVRMVGVKGRSMNDTLFEGDWLLVTPYYNEPTYGDIVICTKEIAGTHGAIVKRVIAVGGDTVEFGANDDVYVNGVKLMEDSYAKPGSTSGAIRGGTLYPGVQTVPEGQVMLMGDNRGDSLDSRYFGFVEVDHLLGKVQLRLGEQKNVYYNFPQQDD